MEIEGAIGLLKRFAEEKQSRLEVIIVGALALHHYGMRDRATRDLDAEVKGDLEGLTRFLRINGVPANLSEDISRWSIVAMPPGYRERALAVYRDPLLEVKVLSPADFIIAKLRRFTEEDIQDAMFVVNRYGVRPAEVERSAEAAIQGSIKDTVVFLFRRNVRLFLEKMRSKSPGATA